MPRKAAAPPESTPSTSASASPDSSSPKVRKGNDAKSQLGALLANDVVSGMLKTYGKRALIEGAEVKARKIKRIPSGIFPLDYALEGGWAQGGVHMLTGHKSSFKTTALYRTIGQAQQMCANCWEHHTKCACKDFREPVIAYLDVEGALDPRWAERFMDLEKILVSTPEYAEQSLSIGEALLRSRKCDIFVLDSIAFLTPAKEIEEAIEKDLMGVQARVLGKGIRKFTAALNAAMSEDGHRPTVFFTNQIRMKLGVMFGCFHGDTPVSFADGSQHRIKDVVENRMEGPVLSWDGTRMVERRIVNWFNNGPLQPGEHWLTFRTDGTHGRRGAQGFTCTPNHKLVTGDGREVCADSVRVGDTLLSWSEETLSATEMEALRGSLFGDGHITPQGNLQFGNSEQIEYARWKTTLFHSLGFSEGLSCERSYWRSTASVELRNIRSRFYGTTDTRGGKNYRAIPLDALRESGPLALAIWYADDGSLKDSHKSASISVKRLTDSAAVNVAACLSERYPGTNYNPSQQAIIFPVDTFRKLSADIAKYLPPCMAYKLLPEHRDQAKGLILPEKSIIRRVPTPVVVRQIRYSKKKHRSTTKYDLQIDGNSFYLVGGDSAGVVVHNSPETNPGGLAPGYMVWTEVKMKGGKYKMDDLGEKPLYVDFGFSIEKNKSSLAKVGYEFRMILTEGESKKLGDIYDEDFISAHLERHGVLTGGGVSWTCLGEKFGKKSEVESRLMTDMNFRRRAMEFLIQTAQPTP